MVTNFYLEKKAIVYNNHRYMFSLNDFFVRFKNGDVLYRILFINILVFVVVMTIKVVMLLFNYDATIYLRFLAAPADYSQLLSHPWTLFSYMFLHEGLFHVAFNLLALYWFGKLFVMYFTQKQLLVVYLLGGLSGYLFFSAAYNFLPLFQGLEQQAVLMGASASIMSIILAVSFRIPETQVQLLLFGAVKLKYIALVTVLMSFFGIASSNAGGEISHLGGALLGAVFVLSLRKGVDITAGINKVFDAISDVFKPRKMRVSKGKTAGKYKMSDAEYNQYKADKMKEIDRILDKIKSSGYDSLSTDEKKQLFEQGKK